MALTKINFYIVSMLIVALISIGWFSFSVDINGDSDISLNNLSYDYISDYSGYIEDSSFENYSNQNIVTIKDDSLLGVDNESGESSVTDFLANLNYFRERVSKIINYFKVVYNFPSFIVSSLGLPIASFSHVINIIGVILFISMMIVIIRLVRGS